MKRRVTLKSVSAGLRKFFRFAWLGRVPVVRVLLGATRRPQACPARRRGSTVQLEVTALESRETQNDLFGIIAGTLAGGILADVALTAATPTQVMMNGWDPYHLGSLPAACEEAPADYHAYDLTPEQADAYFAFEGPLPSSSQQEDRSGATAELPPDHQGPPAETPPLERGDPESVSGEALFRADFLVALDLEGEGDPAAAAGGLAGPSADAADPAEAAGGGGSGGAFNVPPGDELSAAGSGEGGGGDAPTPAESSAADNGFGGPPALAFADDSGRVPAGQSSAPDAAAAPDGGEQAQAPREPLPTPAPQIADSFARLPMAFEANRGQVGAEAQFVSRGRGYNTFLTSTEAVLVLNNNRAGEPQRGEEPRDTYHDVLRVQFAGARSDATLTGQDQLAGRSNYFLAGSDPVQLTDIAQYETVVGHDVYQGVDVVYRGDQQDLRFDFRVGAGADVGQIELNYVGADSVRIDDQGRVVLHTAGGDVVQAAPTLYQDVDGERQLVSGSYELRDGGRVGFRVEQYDTTRELVLDPTLSYGSYLGGTASDTGRVVAVDLQGNFYTSRGEE